MEILRQPTPSLLGVSRAYSQFMERFTPQKWLLLVANLQLVIGVVWSRFWTPAVYICISIWVVLVVAGFALRKRTSN